MALAPAVPPLFRRLLLVAGGLSLVAGVGAGLVRIGWALPPIQPSLVAAHGPLTASGFLGVVIGLERAVALGRRGAFAAPALAGLGGLTIVATLPITLAAWLFAASGLVLVAVFARTCCVRPDWAGALPALGAASWLAGNGLWLIGYPLPQIVPWWAGFLVFTIAGERLELAQLLLRPGARRSLLLATSAVLAGLLTSVVSFEPGARLAGLGLVAIAGWGICCDVARRGLRQPGLPRFMSSCVLGGYLWLGVAGLLWLLGAEMLGGRYDATVHSVFLGFAFSMIFGHAPMIIPAVAGLAVPFQRGFYLHLGLLHGSLLLRIVSDLAAWPEGRRWGGLFNAAAILLFALVTARAARQASQRASAGR